MATDLSITVGDLVELIDRAKKSYTEAGHPELAEHAHVRVLADGRVRLSSRDPGQPSTNPVAEKFLSIDPVFKGADDGR